MDNTINELDILKLFYDAMKAQGVSRETIFLNIDDTAVAMLTHRLHKSIRLEEAHRLTDICIANEWLERTTVDPGYNFLSLTAAGLQVVLANEYSQLT